jgi:hypothetical protein
MRSAVKLRDDCSAEELRSGSGFGGCAPKGRLLSFAAVLDGMSRAAAARIAFAEGWNRARPITMRLR